MPLQLLGPLLLNTALAQAPVPPSGEGAAQEDNAPRATPTGALQGEPKGVGLGLVLGEPTGISLGWRSGDTGFVQGAVAWSALNDSMHITGDYCLNLTFLTTPDAPNLRWPIYAGIGGRVVTRYHRGNRAGIGARVPVGVGLLPSDVRIDAFLEIVPVVLLVPVTDVELEAGLGARYWF